MSQMLKICMNFYFLGDFVRYKSVRFLFVVGMEEGDTRRFSLRFDHLYKYGCKYEN